jgi:hypothetical protein
MFAIAVVLWSIANYSFAVDATEEPLVIEKRANVDITVDGVMDEPVWASVPYFGEFVVIEPDTLAVLYHAWSVRRGVERTTQRDTDRPAEFA